jgi:crossover junction endodeoxyribonuclease RusA
VSRTIIEAILPIRTVSEANMREHWGAKAKRAKEQRRIARWTLAGSCRGMKKAKRITITLTRVGVRNLDSDNLARSMKAVRDGIADALGIDDGDARLTWFYRQERGEYAVKVKIDA